MSSSTPIDTTTTPKIWVRYDEFLWLCDNTTVCPVYLELCRRHSEDKQLQAASEACKEAHVAVRTAWKIVEESIERGTDTQQAIVAANVVQARYDELGEYRELIRAITRTRQEKWIVGKPVVRKFA
ncbi:hypothetical protein MMC18_000764 [Xylographa bjoerkii]|nr:hypothetical protein [Xylographa bjoerkii]